MTQDFWIVPEPAWLDARFPAEAKKVGRPCVALVSTNTYWMTFMKLRLDRVLVIKLEESKGMTKEEALKSNGKRRGRGRREAGEADDRRRRREREKLSILPCLYTYQAHTNLCCYLYSICINSCIIMCRASSQVCCAC